MSRNVYLFCIGHTNIYIRGMFVPKHTASLFKCIIVRTFCSDCMEYSILVFDHLGQILWVDFPRMIIEHTIFEFSEFLPSDTLYTHRSGKIWFQLSTFF